MTPACDVIIFEINLIFLIKSFSDLAKKSRGKLKYLENEKSFKVELKIFFVICKGLSLNQIKHFLLEDESPTLKKANQSITSILLYGHPTFSTKFNTNILDSSFKYILSTKRSGSVLYRGTHS